MMPRRLTWSTPDASDSRRTGPRSALARRAVDDDGRRRRERRPSSRPARTRPTIAFRSRSISRCRPGTSTSRFASSRSRGKVDQAGGIAIRLADADNYYVVRANALEDNVRFYRVVKGRREQLEGADLKVAPNEWHQLGLAPKASASPSRSTASRCSPRPTAPSLARARSRSGPRPTA